MENAKKSESSLNVQLNDDRSSESDAGVAITSDRDNIVNAIAVGTSDDLVEAAVIPKKRGRPAKIKKVAATKQPEATVVATVRGRGRPPKNQLSVANGAESHSAKKPKLGADSTEKSEPAAGAHENSETLGNGDFGENGTSLVVSVKGRGRPPKSASKKKGFNVVATGKGRGRPKKVVKSDSDESSDSDNEKTVAINKTTQKRAPAKSPKKLPGRPRKATPSDEESDESDYELRPLGRPSTGAVNLNIQRTGRGQGRPKKVLKLPIKRSAIEVRGNENGGNDSNVVGTIAANIGNTGATTSKRGRPSMSSNKGTTLGKPRGRPKSNTANVSSVSEAATSSAGDDDGDGNISIGNQHYNDEEEVYTFEDALSSPIHCSDDSDEDVDKN